jgi:hypothetical protein
MFSCVFPNYPLSFSLPDFFLGNQLKPSSVAKPVGMGQDYMET